MTVRRRPALVVALLAVALGGQGAARVTRESIPCPDIYDTGTLQTFELEMARDELEQMHRDCAQQVKTYRPATFRYGSEAARVMVRLKGNWSFRCDKMQFVVSFNETDPDARFHGVRKLVLDAPWYDPSLLGERVGFAFMKRTGNYWSCANTARLMLNGEYYGTFTNVERLDEAYLQRHFPADEVGGSLYEGGVELKTNEALNDTRRRDALLTARDLASIEALADLSEAVKVWASLAMLPDPDSYWAGVEINYYLYDHPKRGFLWLPVDMDMTMRQVKAEKSSFQVGVQEDLVRADPLTYEHPSWRRENIYRIVLSDAAWCGRFLDELRRARDAYDVPTMSREIDLWAAQITDAVRNDPHRTFTFEQHLEGVAALKAFMPKRFAFVDGWLRTARCPVQNWP
jgi:hypothetical protein